MLCFMVTSAGEEKGQQEMEQCIMGGGSGYKASLRRSLDRV